MADKDTSKAPKAEKTAQPERKCLADHLVDLPPSYSLALKTLAGRRGSNLSFEAKMTLAEARELGERAIRGTKNSLAPKGL
jgi:hypothetical protein